MSINISSALTFAHRLCRIAVARQRRGGVLQSKLLNRHTGHVWRDLLNARSERKCVQSGSLKPEELKLTIDSRQKTRFPSKKQPHWRLRREPLRRLSFDRLPKHCGKT